MKRIALILLLGLVVGVHADDFVDDVYYSSADAYEKKSDEPPTPYYNKKQMEQIIFLDDTLPEGQYADTVRAIIRR